MCYDASTIRYGAFSMPPQGEQPQPSSYDPNARLSGPFTEVSQPNPALAAQSTEPYIDPSAPRSRKRWPKVLGGIGIVLLVLVVALYNLPHILNLFTSDIPPIDDSDLIPEVRNVPLEQNGWRFVEELNAEVERTGLADEPLKELLENPDTAEIERILAKNERVLELFEQIADAPDYQEPALADLVSHNASARLTSLTYARLVTKLELITAQQSFVMGESTSTVRSVEHVLTVAQHSGKTEHDINFCTSLAFATGRII